MNLNYKSLSGFIGAGYFIIGILVILYNKFIIEMDPKWARILGALFILYGLFRVYRAIKFMKQK
ncbi:C4-dicarboxylate ABC transporter [Apibacter raozihei]|uniref:C4-dicarboxylate ABC transporter n=1 Tax=Apibacter raozihei TaxID=2500547 RepID=UPI0013E2E683|nr:C4-dicarboxylate ABC transporter [Apibacter raozihei]